MVELNKATFEELKAELNKRGFCVTRPLELELTSDYILDNEG